MRVSTGNPGRTGGDPRVFIRRWQVLCADTPGFGSLRTSRGAAHAPPTPLPCRRYLTEMGSCVDRSACTRTELPEDRGDGDGRTTGPM